MVQDLLEPVSKKPISKNTDSSDQEDEYLRSLDLSIPITQPIVKSHSFEENEYLRNMDLSIPLAKQIVKSDSLEEDEYLRNMDLSITVANQMVKSESFEENEYLRNLILPQATPMQHEKRSCDEEENENANSNTAKKTKIRESDEENECQRNVTMCEGFPKSWNPTQLTDEQVNADIEFLRSLFQNEPDTHNQTQPQTRERAANRPEVAKMAKRSLINEVKNNDNNNDSLNITTTEGNTLQHNSRIYN